MSDTPTTPPPTKSIADSLTLKSAAAIAVAFVASRFSIDLPEGVAQQFSGAIVDLVTTLGLIGVAIGRARARGPIV